MGKSVYDGIIKAANMAVYQERIYSTAGIKFRLGMLDKISGANYMAVSMNKIHYSDGLKMTAVIVSKEDIRVLSERYDKSEVLTMIQFCLGHEVGHLQDFKSFPDRRIEDIDELKEAEADVYSAIHNNLSVSEYKKCMDILRAGMETEYERTFYGINKFLHKKLNGIIMKDRIDKVIAELNMHERMEADTMYRDLAEYLYKECRKKKVIQFNHRNNGGKRNG